MPVYKTPEKYLRAAIESILQQTFTDFEFLILDDYPLDNRQKIVASYADKRIKYFKICKIWEYQPVEINLLTWQKVNI